MVQWLAHLTCDPGDAGSIPTYGIISVFILKGSVRCRYLFTLHTIYICIGELIFAELLTECLIVIYSVVHAKQINNIFDWSFSLLFSFVQHNWCVALIRWNDRMWITVSIMCLFRKRDIIWLQLHAKPQTKHRRPQQIHFTQEDRAAEILQLYIEWKLPQGIGCLPSDCHDRRSSPSPDLRGTKKLLSKQDTQIINPRLLMQIKGTTPSSVNTYGI